jgi:hypothetical protein
MRKGNVMAHKGSNVKTPIGDLKYVFIKGDGRNQAMPGNAPAMKYVASIIFKKDSATHKTLDKLINAEWARYCEATGQKGSPDTDGIKSIKEESKTEVDKFGTPLKIETGNMILQMSTNVMFKDKKTNVKVLDHKGRDLTKPYQSAEWGIGEGSQGILHGLCTGNGTGGAHKVTWYLNAVQLTKLVKYEGQSLDIEEVEGEDIDFGMDELTADADTDDTTPDL